MSQTRSCREVREHRSQQEIALFHENIKKTLQTKWVLLFFYEERRPGTMQLLSDQILMSLDQRPEIVVS